MSTNWVIMQITDRASKMGNVIQEITFANTKGEIAYTYIDPANDNYARWKDIIKGYDEGLGIVVTGLKYKKNSYHKRTGDPLVNADSLVKVVHCEDTMDQLLREFVQIIHENQQTTV